MITITIAFLQSRMPIYARVHAEMTYCIIGTDVPLSPSIPCKVHDSNQGMVVEYGATCWYIVAYLFRSKLVQWQDVSEKISQKIVKLCHSGFPCLFLCKFLLSCFHPGPDAWRRSHQEFRLIVRWSTATLALQEGELWKMFVFSLFLSLPQIWTTGP